MNYKSLAVIVGCAALLLTGSAYADDYVFTLKDHKFTPEQLIVPAGQKIKITVRNMDKTPAEFESFDLNREKVVKGGEEVTVILGPLDAGVYQVFDDFHKDTTTGTIKAQ
ncbi:MAG: cupredoxin domain-containing protein [Alphaproteobacteria bacterium]|nr:MAG: cupredoxin domain-containing protein [Alphaproteobacteria bacterium]